MLDFSWSELALIGAVALVVIGPKDLPRALRTAGQWARKARTISREFQSSIEQMVREAELDEAKRELEKVTSVSVTEELQRAVDPSGSLAADLEPHKLLEERKPAGEPTAEPTIAAAPPAAEPQQTSPGAAEPKQALPGTAGRPDALPSAPERPPVHAEPLPAAHDAPETPPARREGTS